LENVGKCKRCIVLLVLSLEIEIDWKENTGKLSDRSLAPCCPADSTSCPDKMEQNLSAILSSVTVVTVDRLSYPRLLFLGSQDTLDFGIQLLLFPV
jgi:hypothetical protein